MKHVDQAFPQGRGAVDVECAQSDDSADAGRSRSWMTEGTIGADHNDRRPAAAMGALPVVALTAGLASARMAARMAAA
jgi:hypothetical protein